MFAKGKVPSSLIDMVKDITESQWEKEKTSTGTKVYGSSYGNSAKAKKDQTKKEIDTLKGPTEKNLHNKDSTGTLYHHSVKEEGECVTKPEAKDIAKKEVKGHEKKMHKESTLKDRLVAAIREEQEVDQQINEVLKKDASAGEWIHDFVHSDNPKFAGKSKAERKKQALAAYYAKQNEELEQVGEAIDPKNPKDYDKPAFMRKAAGHSLGLKDVKAKDTKAKTDYHSRLGLKTEEDMGTHPDDKEDEAEDEKLIKKMVKKDALKKEEVEQVSVKKTKGVAEAKPKVAGNEPFDYDKWINSPKKMRPVSVPLKGDDGEEVGRMLTGRQVPVKKVGKKETPWMKSKETETDKSGAKHTPMSRAKDLAHSALKKVKKDMGHK